MVQCQLTMSHAQTIILHLQDRLRKPWKGGATHISICAVLPIVALPALLCLASLGIYYTITSAILMIGLILVAYRIHVRTASTTKFFVMWTVMSILTIWCIFAYKVQPLLEITREENIAFSIMFIGAIFCIHRLRTNAGHESVSSGMEGCVNGDVNEVLLESNEQCSSCKTERAQRATHCPVCQTCVTSQDYHCAWFDCCIGKSNRRLYVLFLVLEIGALSYGSNLTLTTVCNHFVFYKTILLPNDCGEVYDQFELALCFISGVYSLAITLVLIWYLVQQCWFISLGVTGSEWRRHNSQVKSIFCLNPRPYSHGIFKNWTQFFLGKN